MEQALAAAEVRKRDQLRAKDKMLQREREAEGEEFGDKAKYVTGAYKKQQEDVRRMEEEERRREERERKKGTGTGGGMFMYRRLMEEEDKRKEMVEGEGSMGRGGKEEEEGGKVGEEEKNGIASDADAAHKLNSQGANIVINEDGEVALKSQLLSAGLNVAPKPKQKSSTLDSGPGGSTAPSSRPSAPSSLGAGAGAGASSAHNRKQAMRERQTKLIEDQLAQATKRAAEEEEEEERKLREKAKSRKTEGEIGGARERYLARKREAAEAAAGGKK